MFEFVKLPARLKTLLIAASTGFAGGDILPVIVISSLFSVVHRGTTPKERTMQRYAPVDYSRATSSLSADQSFDFEGAPKPQ
ncbi:MAG: hypothetical protein J0H40_03020 [Rhizobiales bacterium]|nr:hypothetical protein [Hyphomicrobiales bacterium]